MAIPSWVYLQLGLPAPMQPGLGVPTSALEGVPAMADAPPDAITGADPAATAPPEAPVSPEGAPVTPPQGTPPPQGLDPLASPVGSVDDPRNPAADAITGADPARLPPPPPQPVSGPAAPLTDEQRTQRLNDDIERALRPPALGSVDASGRPVTELSADDITFKGMVQADQALLMGLDSLRLSGSLAAEEARRTAPHLAAYAEEVANITRQGDEDVRRAIAEVRRGWDDARAAAAEADAAHPNPDDLLGGKGSWTRAMAFAMSSAYAGVPGSSIAQVIDQQIALGMAGQQARYDRLKARSESLADIASKQANAIDNVAGGYKALAAAAKDRLAARLEQVGNGLSEPRARLSMLEAARKLTEQSAKDKYELAKTVAEIRLKEAQAAKEQGLALKATSKLGGGGVGGGIPAGPTSAHSKGSIVLSNGESVPEPDSKSYTIPLKVNDFNGRRLMSNNPDLFGPGADKTQARELERAMAGKVDSFAKLSRKMGEVSDLMRQVNEERSTKGSISQDLASTVERKVGYLIDAVLTPELATEYYNGKKPALAELHNIQDRFPKLKNLSATLLNGDYSPLEVLDMIQGDLEHDIVDFANIHGIDYGPMLRSATGRYFSKHDLVEPSPDAKIAAATAAQTKAQTGTEADRMAAAKALRDAQKAKETEEKTLREGERTSRRLLDHGPPQGQLGAAPPGISDELSSVIATHDQAAASAQGAYDHWRKAYQDRSYLNKVKGEGARQAAERAHLAEVGQLAREASEAMSALVNQQKNVANLISSGHVDPTLRFIMQERMGPGVRWFGGRFLRDTKDGTEEVPASTVLRAYREATASGGASRSQGPLVIPPQLKLPGRR